MITSSRVVLGALAESFGALPPAMLPVNNRLLVVEQMARLSCLPGRRFLTLPEDFFPASWQRRHLREAGLQIVFLPAELQPAHALAAALRQVASDDGPCHVLCGATLADGLVLDRSDVVGHSEAPAHPLPAYIGLSAPLQFAAAIEQTCGDGRQAMDRYRARRPLGEGCGARFFFFGEVDSFYRSRRSFLSARAFNSVCSHKGAVKKCSDDDQKIAAESQWLARLPTSLRGYTPRFLGRHQRAGKEVYEVEYLPLATLSEMFVYGDARPSLWEDIFCSCADFLRACQGHLAGAPVAFEQLYLPKTEARLRRAQQQRGWSLSETWTYNGTALTSLHGLMVEAAEHVRGAGERRATLMHGDFCFSNILYQQSTRSIKVIDPRGFVTAGQPTLFGDPLYDLVKLFHSCLGLYDLLVAGAYACRIEGTRAELDIFATRGQQEVGELFRRRWLGHATGAEKIVASAAILLFLSMLPLHQDSPARQDAFLANALRLAVRHGLGRRGP